MERPAEIVAGAAGIDPAAGAREIERALWRHVDARRWPGAIAVCRELNARYPGYAPGWGAAGELALRAGDLPAARRAIERAIELDAGNPSWHVQKARCLRRLGEVSQALAIASSLARDERLEASQCSTLAALLLQLGHEQQALDLYRRAQAQQPGSSTHCYNVAVVLRSLGQIAEAEAQLDAAIRLAPDDADAHYLRAQLRVQQPDANHVNELEAFLERITERPGAAAKIHYALGKELEDLQRYEECFTHLERGADLRRRTMTYDPAAELATMSSIERVFDARRFVSPGQGYDDAAPIFILGMPRTGSTLLERVIGSHSRVRAVGELGNFSLALMRLVRGSGGDPRIAREALVERSATLDFRALGEAYISSVRPLVGDAPHFTDKLPLNFLYVGLIRLALPRATVIHVRRHPLDTCFAIYKTLFRDAYPYSYRLDELGRYYLAYRRLMDHWDRVLPGVVHHVDYERLVTQPEAESRRLLTSCGLSWEEGCQRSHENPRAVATASASQVRRPVYRTSIGRWRPFARQLQPLIQVLRAGGLDLEDTY